jgi:hypothetical protein
MISPQWGLSGTRARVGLKPNTPQQEQDLIDPPPSLACAIGTMPAATAAADPPLDPPGVRVRSQGLRVGPNSSGSVVGNNPNSGVLVLATTIRPARLTRETSSVSDGARNRSRSAIHR